MFRKATLAAALALVGYGLMGCEDSVQSRADDLASCLSENGVEHGSPSSDGGTLIADGQSIDLDHAELTLLPKRGPGPPDKVALFDSEEPMTAWADLTRRNVRDKGQKKRVVVLADEQAVFVPNNGGSPHRAVLEKCLGEV